MENNKTDEERIREIKAWAKEGCTINPNIPDFSKDPYFVAKREQAQKLLIETGLVKKTADGFEDANLL